MNKTLWQRLIPHITAIGIFFSVSCLYSLPAFKGLVVNSHDVLGWKGMAQQSFEFKEKHGHFPLWTNSLFSGMPAYQISIESKHNVTVAWLHYLFTLFLPSPASLFFLSCICFYILCLALRLHSWVGIFGGLAYAFASYSAILVVAGHTTKFASMGYTPAVLAGIILLTQQKYVLGFITTMVFTTLLMYQNHVQIVYYTFLILACLAVAFVIQKIKAKQIRHLGISAALAIAAVGIAVLSYAVMLIPLNEYAKETMRGGKSELTIGEAQQNKSKGGLDKEYAFLWSYGIDETMTAILPGYKGGSSGPSELGEDGNAVQALQDAQLPPEAINYFYGDLSSYWGDQPSTSGPVYFGVLVCLLFIAGLFIVRSWHIGWIVAASIIGIVLAWGRHLESINYFLFDYLPYYNKFRAPSMSLVIPQLTFALLACQTLQHISFGEWRKEDLLKKLKFASITTGVVLAILLFTYFIADFKSKNDRQLREGISSVLTQMMGQTTSPSQQVRQQADGIAASVLTGVIQDRKNLYSGDLLRTIVFVLLGSGLIWVAVQKKLKPLYILIGFVIINLIDLLGVDNRYLNTDRYLPEEEFLDKFTPNRADLQIKQDTGYFRVYDQSSPNPYDDSRTSYHHNDVAGHHPAKLGLYNDLITHQLSKGNMKVFDMLNTKYFIVTNPQDRQPVAQQNPGALGPAWLVKSIKYVNNANEEMMALDTFNPKDTAIINKKEQSKIPFPPQFDSAGSIQLLQNLNDKIEYSFNAASNQFVVFSEVYYPYGWKAFINEKEAPIVKVNYVLRGLAVPAGNHKIEFRFEPKSIRIGDTISLIIGIMSFLLIFFAIWWEWKIQKTPQPVIKAKT